MNSRSGLKVEVVNGRHQTDAVDFPEGDINHTVLSEPVDKPKILHFDCHQVEVAFYPGGSIRMLITSASEKGEIVTELSLSPKTDCVLSRSVRGN